MSTHTDRRSRLLRAASYLLFVIPAIALLIGGWSFRWLAEDSFINLRAVRHIFGGYGYTFNIGDRVEVGTSPIWILVLLLLAASRIPLEYGAVVGGLLAACGGVLFAQAGTARLLGKTPGHSGLVPVGSAIIVAPAVTWEFAASGLDTGIDFFWMGFAYYLVAIVVVKHEAGGVSRFAWFATSVVAGLGPLLRPELALVSVTLCATLAYSRIRTNQAPQGRAAGLAMLLASSLALPTTYQIFRMGYFGTIVPNTALAKEAFGSDWGRGVDYVLDFNRSYQFWFPTVAALVVLAVTQLGGRFSRTRQLALAAPLVASAGLLIFVVRLGGDYMHGRFLLPVIFLFLCPIAIVEVRWGSHRSERIVCCVSVLAGIWAIGCGAFARPRGIADAAVQDERLLQLEMAKREHPITLADHRDHPFPSFAQKALARLRSRCPQIDERPESCRQLLLSIGDDGHSLGRHVRTVPLSRDIDVRIAAAVNAGPIGMFSASLPDNVYIIDSRGLADPLASRLLVTTRGLPGHEKRLPLVWTLARYGAPSETDSKEVEAARRALGCGALAAALRSTSNEMTVHAFVSNVRNAWTTRSVRVPTNPFAAEAEFCAR